MNLQENLMDSYIRDRYQMEIKVIDSLDHDPRAFYRFATAKSVIKTSVGPLKNKHNILKYESAKILNGQYSSIKTKPKTEVNDKFMSELIMSDNNSKLCDIYFSKDDIQEAISKLSCKSGPGHDGIPPHFLKYSGNLIIEAITDIANISTKISYISGKLRGVWVTPIWKHTDREDPSDYNPISITNHILSY